MAKATDLQLKVAKLEGRVKQVLSDLNRSQASASLIKDLADLYLEQYVKVQNRHPKSTENRVNLVVHELGHIPVSELTVFDVTSYMSRKKKRGPHERPQDTNRKEGHGTGIRRRAKPLKTKWRARPDSNGRPADSKSDALSN